MYKVSKGFSGPIITELFKTSEEQQYNLAEFAILVIRTAYHGSETILFAGPKLKKTLSNSLKNGNSRKSEIKKWTPENCSCRLCR